VAEDARLRDAIPAEQKNKKYNSTGQPATPPLSDSEGRRQNLNQKRRGSPVKGCQGPTLCKKMAADIYQKIERFWSASESSGKRPSRGEIGGGDDEGLDRTSSHRVDDLSSCR
jgi:hypothetical protein